MTKGWVDEMPDHEPLLELEPFFTLMAIELGDPDGRTAEEGNAWLRKNTQKFYDLYHKYFWDRAPPCIQSAALVQYLVWYERESRRVKAGKSS